MQTRTLLTPTAVETKIRLFTGDDPQRVARDLEEWLAAASPSLLHVAQSQCERNGKLLFVLSIFYN